MVDNVIYNAASLTHFISSYYLDRTNASHFSYLPFVISSNRTLSCAELSTTFAFSYTLPKKREKLS